MAKPKTEAKSMPTAIETDVERRAIACAMVEAVETFVAGIVRLRELVSKGGDATAAAGELAGALLAVGARIPEGRGDQLRWFINESPTPLADPLGLGGAQSMFVYMLAALKRGNLFPGEDERLADIAHHWPSCRTKAEAEAKVAAVEGERADAIVRAATAKHDEWLASRPKTAPTPAHVGPPPPKPLFSDDNDLTVG